MNSKRSSLKLRNRKVPEKKLSKSLKQEKLNKYKQQNIIQELDPKKVQIKNNVERWSDSEMVDEFLFKDLIDRSSTSKLWSHLGSGDESGCNYPKESCIEKREERETKRKRKRDRELEAREREEQEREEREREKYEREGCEREDREREDREREEREQEEREQEEREREDHEREKREREKCYREKREREKCYREAQELEEKEREQSEQEREERKREQTERERNHADIEERESVIADPLAFKILKRKIRIIEKNETVMYKKIDCIAKDLQEIKNVLKSENRSNANFDEDSYLALLPKFPLKKIKHVNTMEASVNESNEYKQRLLYKVSTIGGSTVKKNVINIFKRMFSPKLKTKFCWNGTVRGKVEFKNYEGILDVLRKAVRCTESELEEECKLRFNQAQKDYEREQQKNA